MTQRAQNHLMFAEPTDMSPEEAEYYEFFTPLIRDYSAQDQNYIMVTWLKSYILECFHMSKERYYAKMQHRIKRLVTAPNCTVKLMVDKNHPAFIVAFAIGENPPKDTSKPIILHWAYVRHAYRQQGIFKTMLRELGWEPGRKVLVTHRSRSLSTIWRRFDFEHDKFLLEGITIPKDYDPPEVTT